LLARLWVLWLRRLVASPLSRKPECNQMWDLWWTKWHWGKFFQALWYSLANYFISVPYLCFVRDWYSKLIWIRSVNALILTRPCATQSKSASFRCFLFLLYTRKTPRTRQCRYSTRGNESNIFNKHKPNTWLDTQAWRNITWMKHLECVVHQKESRALSWNTPCTPDDGQLGWNMLWNKAEPSKPNRFRLSCTRTDENQNSIHVYTQCKRMLKYNQYIVNTVKALCCKPEGRGFKSRWGGFF
jgi:hypothetical protein